MPRGMHPNSRKALEENRKKNFKNIEKAVEAGKKGGKALGENNRKRRTMKEELEILLNSTIEQKDKRGKVISTMTGSEAINAALFQRASEGDTKAYEIIRDTVGEKPVEVVAVSEIDAKVIEEIESIVNEQA